MVKLLRSKQIFNNLFWNFVNFLFIFFVLANNAGPAAAAFDAAPNSTIGLFWEPVEIFKM